MMNDSKKGLVRMQLFIWERFVSYAAPFTRKRDACRYNTLHISKVEEYIKRYTDIGITRLKPEHPFEYYFFDVRIHHRKKTKFNERLGTDSHNGFSWPGPKMRWCTDRLKTRPRTKFLRDYRKEYNIIEYVGIAADEEYRLRRKINDRENKRYPLVDWGMTEADCLKYCYDRGFDWGGLYEKFSRVSCWYHCRSFVFYITSFPTYGKN